MAFSERNGKSDPDEAARVVPTPKVEGEEERPGLTRKEEEDLAGWRERYQGHVGGINEGD